MTVFADWAVGLCAAGVACALLRMLCPEGALREGLRVVTALLFFCCLLSPLGMLKDWLSDGLRLTAEASPSMSNAVAARVDEQALAIIEEALLQDAAARLEHIAINRVEVVRDDTDELLGIRVERVRVVFAKEEHPLPAAIPHTLEQAWGVPVEVYYSDDNNMDNGL